MSFLKLICVLVLMVIPSTLGIYTEERIQAAVEDFAKMPMLQNDEMSRLKVRDLFVLANKEIPEAYMRNDGVAHIVPSDPYVDEHAEHLAKLQEAAETVIEAFGVQAAPSPPSHIGLDQSCSDKLCNMMEFLVSCKAFNLGIRKICAKYLFGSFYKCSQFPNYDDSIYDAPSVCLPEYITLLATVVTGIKGLSKNLQTDISNYLLANFTTNACGRRCYQSYQYYSNDFYLNCGAQVAQYNKSYPFPAAIAIFQPFRNQACGKNPKNDSCYVQVSTTFAEIQFLNKSIYHGSLDLPDIAHDYTCNYYDLSPTSYNQTIAQKNLAVLQKSCGILTKAQCCAGSGISIVQLNQIEALKKKTVLFPPCFLNYQRLSCPAVDLSEMCTKGSMADQATIQGYITIPKKNPQTFTNVYSQQSLLLFQKVITVALATFGFKNQPFNFDQNYPFQVYVVGYAYFNATGYQLTPTDGSTAYPPGSDYANAASGTFYYQIVMQNVNAQQAAQVQTFLTSGNFLFVLSVVFGGGSTAGISAAITTPATVYDAQPDVLASSASGSFIMNSLVLFPTILFVAYQLFVSPLR